MMDKDLIRLRKEYAERKKRKYKTNLYSVNSAPMAFTIQKRMDAVKKALIENGATVGKNDRLLEIGCGSGGILSEYQQIDFNEGQLMGVDLLFDRLEEAHNSLPSAGIANADGQSLPFSIATFDYVLQYTAFSSILDPSIKKRMGLEMIRVLKPTGMIIWYDFWWNPLNPQTRGIRQGEIRALFPECTFRLSKVTLAPPIARLLVPISKKIAGWLERQKFLNSHYLVLIKK